MNTHSQSSPRLPLTHEERARLRRHRIKLWDIAELGAGTLAAALDVSDDRAAMLWASAQFQSIPTVGPAAAQWPLDLGYRSLEALREESGPALLDRMEVLYGHWMDPCVEDVLWCVVHHANHPGSDKVWYHFTDERKSYRMAEGYPSSRPTRTWYDVSEPAAP